MNDNERPSAASMEAARALLSGLCKYEAYPRAHEAVARALDAAEALGFKRGMETARVLAIGCHDYGGGYEGTDSRAYHHGMDTVVNVISAVLTKGHDTQTAAVMAEGRARLSEREKGGACDSANKGPKMNVNGSRWDLLKRTTPSGKSLFSCTECGRESQTPDKLCHEDGRVTCGDARDAEKGGERG